MNETMVSAMGPVAVTGWTADALFAALGDPVRRRLLLTLADGVPRTASELTGSAERTLDATLKHLVTLRAGGVVVKRANPGDARRQLYSLAHGVTVRTLASGGREIDFGPCLVRL
jgi:DNA-binding transcriptional ArsR family regulator